MRRKTGGYIERERCDDFFEHKFCSVAAISAAAAIGGSMITANAAGDAADQQSQSAAEATAARERAAAQMREDLKPWTSSGGAAQAALNQRLGLGMGTSGTVNGLQSGLTRDKLREQLLSQYTRTVQPPAQPAAAAPTPAGFSGFNLAGGGGVSQYGGDGDATGVPGWYDNKTATPAATTEVDEAGLNAAIEKYFADQTAQEGALAKDPAYGSLLKQFTGDDLENDPGYQFGREQGQLGVDRAQAARGNFLSGAAIKEASRFNSDYAGTKFNEAYTRDSSDKSRIYNFLNGVSTLGQNSAAQVGSGALKVGDANAGNLLSSGNAQSAATVAGGNAWNSGLNSAANALNSRPNGPAGWNQMLAGQAAQSQNTGVNYLQNGYDAFGMPNNI